MLLLASLGVCASYSALKVQRRSLDISDVSPVQSLGLELVMEQPVNRQRTGQWDSLAGDCFEVRISLNHRVDGGCVVVVVMAMKASNFATHLVKPILRGQTDQ